MARLLHRWLTWLADWRRFCALLTIVFLVRGVTLVSILPPFEGWDEYQHLAYAVFLLEEDRPPLLDDAPQVPDSLYPHLRRFPHSADGAEQLAPIGAKPYEQFWNSPAPTDAFAGRPSVHLYQAQHSAFYYRLVLPIVRLIYPTGDLLSLIAILRFLNLLFAAAALYLACRTIGWLTLDGPHRYLIALLAVYQPLFLLNSGRVAGDALGVMLGTAAICLLLMAQPRRLLASSVAGGVILGLAILAKTVNLGLVPFALVAVASAPWRLAGARKRTAAGLVLFLVALAATTYPYLHFNITHFGLLAPLQEAVDNKAAGVTTGDLFRAAADIDWWYELSRRYLRHSLWVGGWSFLQIDRSLTRLHELFICLAMAGGLWMIPSPRRRCATLFARRGDAPLLILLALSMAAALCYHMVQAQAHLGSVSTNVWYAAVSFPWLLCLFYRGLLALPGRWTAPVLAIFMLVVFLATELRGTFGIMIPFYTQAPLGALTGSRLAQMHPAWLPPTLTAAALVIQFLLTCLALAVLFNRLFRSRLQP